METCQQFINGALVDSQSTEWIDVENPYTNEVIARALHECPQSQAVYIRY